jgi:hypothetical protein
MRGSTAKELSSTSQLVAMFRFIKLFSHWHVSHGLASLLKGRVNAFVAVIWLFENCSDPS